MQATVAQGQRQGGVDARLEKAEAALRYCDMKHYAVAAKYGLGQIVGSRPGKQLMRSGSDWLREQQRTDWLREQQIVSPERLIDLLDPGPWMRRYG